MKRRSFLIECLRGGLLVGLVGLGAVLAAREDKFMCNKQCQGCQKFKLGKCQLEIL